MTDPDEKRRFSGYMSGGGRFVTDEEEKRFTQAYNQAASRDERREIETDYRELIGERYHDASWNAQEATYYKFDKGYETNESLMVRSTNTNEDEHVFDDLLQPERPAERLIGAASAGNWCEPALPGVEPTREEKRATNDFATRKAQARAKLEQLTSRPAALSREEVERRQREDRDNEALERGRW